MMRVGLLLIALSAANGSSYDNFADADSFLESVGVPSGLPPVTVKYPVGTFGRKQRVEGSSSHFKAPDEVHDTPVMSWEPQADGDGNKRKFAMLMVAPDEPERASDGAAMGEKGPYIHWMKLNCEADSTTGNEIFKYEPPRPAAGTGVHRYIFLLFLQTAPPAGGMAALTPFMEVYTRANWRLADFVRDFEGSMEPVGANMFYGSHEGEQAEPAAAAKPPKQELKMKPPGASSLGPGWAAAKPAHDEL